MPPTMNAWTNWEQMLTGRSVGGSSGGRYAR